MLRRPLAALTALAAIAVPLIGVPAHAADPDPGSTEQPPTSTPVTSTPAAAEALAAAEELTTPAAPPASPDAPGGRDATMVLRDLRMQRDHLGTADRARARAVLQRPATTQKQCFTTFCIHWSTTGDDRATADYVAQVADVVSHVLSTYRAAGYRSPEPDGTRGGNNKLDIYLQDLGSQGLYGYCDSDDPPTGTGPFDAPAYCAFDNNYTEFPTNTPLENLQVTAAHELFHAVQFAYDYYEDSWFMEATATWAEDEVYTDVNDNLQYLSESPLAQPGRSMDHFEQQGFRQYGDWIFFRWLTERDPRRTGALPNLIRGIWQRADGSAGAPDNYSIQAVDRTLRARGSSLRREWMLFTSANRRPAASYDEGRANHYPVAPLSGRVTLTGRHRDSQVSRSIDHLAASTVRFQRGSGLAARSLRLTFDLPPTGRGMGAVLTTYFTSGRVSRSLVSLPGTGNGAVRRGFGPGVKAIEVTLSNAGIRYTHCYRGTAWSCQGTPLDNDLPFKVRATALR
ncbi:MXAN_6640 family putative metalloprotease [Nocardioides sp.]|uniref:MXAN_6640 family putative metalloprotease n=1 Tax=Nocardioides sp. TaxID=35761 RepID=UPI0037851A18